MKKETVGRYKVEINKQRCKGCRLCVFFCPVKHLELSEDLNNRGVRFAVAKEGAECIGCGFCFVICPDVCVKIES